MDPTAGREARSTKSDLYYYYYYFGSNVGLLFREKDFIITSLFNVDTTLRVTGLRHLQYYVIFFLREVASDGFDGILFFWSKTENRGALPLGPSLLKSFGCDF